jgi:hypothetical protein
MLLQNTAIETAMLADVPVRVLVERLQAFPSVPSGDRQVVARSGRVRAAFPLTASRAFAEEDLPVLFASVDLKFFAEREGTEGRSVRHLSWKLFECPCRDSNCCQTREVTTTRLYRRSIRPCCECVP